MGFGVKIPPVFESVSGAATASGGAGTTRYSKPDACGAMAAGANTLANKWIVPADGIVDQFWVSNKALYDANDQTDWTVMINNAATALVATIPADSAAGTIVNDSTHSVAVSKGDEIEYRAVLAAGGPVAGTGHTFGLRYKRS